MTLKTDALVDRLVSFATDWGHRLIVRDTLGQSLFSGGAGVRPPLERFPATAAAATQQRSACPHDDV